MPFGIGFFATAGAGAGGAAFELISTQVLTTTTASVTFSSIPATYRHLQLRMVTRSARTNAGIASLYLNMNGDTSSSSYSIHNLTGDGSSVASGYSAQARIIPGETPTQLSSTGIFGSTVIDILDYANTSKNKTTRALTGLHENSFQRIELKSGLWISTAAITSLAIAESTTLGFVSGSRFSLYGVRG